MSRVTTQIRYERNDRVGVWTVQDLNEVLESGEIEQGERHFRDHAGDPSMSGCVVCIEETDGVGSEALSHVNDQWTTLAEETDVDRVAYVADGITRLAIANKNEASTAEVRAFDDRTAAVDWAADA